MALLQLCPREIKDEILSHLSRVDLVRVSCVSRHFRILAQPLLYRAITLYRDARSRYFFLRSLLTPGREILATYVKSLSVDWDFYIPDHIGELDSDIALVTDGASRLELGDPFLSEGAQVILLLYLLSSLRVLNLSPSHDSDYFADFMDDHHVLQPLLTLPVGLQSLRNFRWGTEDRTDRMSVDLLLTILCLPHIRTIDVQMGDPIHLAVYTAMATATTTIPHITTRSPVTHLIISYGNLGAWWLAGVLKIPLALTHLSHWGGWTLDSGILAFRLAIQPLKHSLRLLNLEFEFALEDEQHTNTIGSLRDWPVLHTVHVPLAALLVVSTGNTSSHGLADVLPACIRDLQIFEDRCWMYDEAVQKVVELLGQKERVPGLQQVGVLTKTWKGFEMEERLQEACSAADMRLVKDMYCFGVREWHGNSTEFVSGI